MIESADWVSPHFNGVRYFEKPILGYWLNSASLELFGETSFAIRLPSALAAIGAGLFLFVFARRFARARAGLIASGVYLTSFGVLAVGTMALLDSMFTLFVTLTLGAYGLALASVESKHRHAWLALSGLACGLAFLTKGFLALAIPALVAGAFLVWERRWREMWTTAWLPIVVAVVTALPWSIAVALKEPDFWHYFFWVEHVGRFLSEDAQHASPWWYYLALAPLVTFPWIVLVPRAGAGLRAGAGGRAGSIDASVVRYLICWAVLPFVFFSASSGKLVTYILPCVAPVALLIGFGLDRAATTEGRLNFKVSAPFLAATLAVVLVLLVAGQHGAFGEPLYGPDDGLNYAAVVATFALAVVAALWARTCRKASLQLVLIGAAVLPLYLIITLAWPARLAEERAPSRFVAEHAADAANAVLVSNSSLFGTTAWALKRSDVYVLGGGEIAYGLSYPEHAHRLLDAGSLATLIRDSGADILIFCDPGTEDEIRAVLPPRTMRTQQGGLVFLRIPAVTRDG
jgi:4-amino-4-deoxy-L-arabinose transferase